MIKYLLLIMMEFMWDSLKRLYYKIYPLLVGFTCAASSFSPCFPFCCFKDPPWSLCIFWTWCDCIYYSMKWNWEHVMHGTWELEWYISIVYYMDITYGAISINHMPIIKKIFKNLTCSATYKTTIFQNSFLNWIKFIQNLNF